MNVITHISEKRIFYNTIEVSILNDIIDFKVINILGNKILIVKNVNTQQENTLIF